MDSIGMTALKYVQENICFSDKFLLSLSVLQIEIIAKMIRSRRRLCISEILKTEKGKKHYDNIMLRDLSLIELEKIVRCLGLEDEQEEFLVEDEKRNDEYSDLMHISLNEGYSLYGEVIFEMSSQELAMCGYKIDDYSLDYSIMYLRRNLKRMLVMFICVLNRESSLEYIESLRKMSLGDLEGIYEGIVREKYDWPAYSELKTEVRLRMQLD